MIEKLFYGRENSWLSVNVNSKVRYEAEYWFYKWWKNS
jgi:hypothetical protein